MLSALLYLLMTASLAALPFGVLVTTYFGEADLRSAGSGNIGATNAWRVYGPRVGLLTLSADILKGLLPVALAPHALGEAGPSFLSLVALAAFAGHCYTPLLAFRGGKGVATTFGAFLGLAPIAALLAALCWAVVVKLTRTSSLGALSALVVLLAAVAAWPPHRPYLAVTVALCVGILWRHRDNIRRLREGAERKV